MDTHFCGRVVFLRASSISIVSKIPSCIFKPSSKETSDLGAKQITSSNLKCVTYFGLQLRKRKVLTNRTRQCDNLQPDHMLHILITALRMHDQAIGRNPYAMSGE